MGKDTFDDIYKANSNLVFRTAMHFSKNYHTAEEITQNTFVQLFLNPDVMKRTNVKSWLLTVTKHQALNIRTKRERETLEEDMALIRDVWEWAEDPGDIILTKERKEDLAEFCDTILQKLYDENTRWYEAIVSVYCLEMPQKEVAAEMNMSVDSLQSMLYRARNWIKKNFMEEYETYFPREKDR